MPIEERARHATVVIDTSGAKEATKAALNEEWAQLLARIEAKR
jgi:dephospho-CoA kinase